MKHVLMIGIQLLKRIEALHGLGYVHGDIKPANIMFGRDKNKNILYLIDYGLTRHQSKMLSSTIDYPSYIYQKENMKLMGTPLYASLNLHLGWSKVFKKDDIESIFYLLVYLAKGSLPWIHIPIVEGDNYFGIYESKANTDIKDLCKGLPMAFRDMYEYILGLDNLESIKYDYLYGKILFL